MKINKLIVFISLVFLSFTGFSQQIVYKPISPFFGGDTFNYQMILASVNAQNDFEEENDFLSAFGEQSDLQNFTESLNRQLLNSISQDLFREQFGDDGSIGVGTFVFGSLVVEITPSSGGLSVVILDTNTGEQTQIIIPN